MWSDLPRIDLGIDPTYHVPDDLLFQEHAWRDVGRFAWAAFCSAALMGAASWAVVMAMYLLEGR
jgi:hypothetical protein